MSPGFARFVLKLIGWRVEGTIAPEIRKFIVIAAPHTSWWDFPLGVFARAAIGRKILFLAKESLFKPPFGWLIRAMGGYPVNRSRSSQVVDTVIAIYKRKTDFAISLAPEGTRKQVTSFRSGFYYIAKGAGIPIICAQFDYGNRRVVFSAPFYPGDDPDADLQTLWNHFAGIRGKRPGQGIPASF